MCASSVQVVLRYRRAKVRHHDQQHALFAAEFGIEAAKVYLAGVCSDPARRSELLEEAFQREISMPGQEDSFSKFSGYSLPGGGSVRVRLRTSVRAAGVFAVTVRSTGQAGAEQSTVDSDVGCPEAGR
jgi:hypothetical protein